jgi:NitT/TauT family transport system ATP-binding protein
VFANLSLQIRTGEFVSLVGPSGCGKTTLLLLLAGFIPVVDHCISISPALRNPAMVFQTSTLFDWMTVQANLDFPMKMRRIPPVERAIRTERLLELVRLSDVTHRYPAELSHGMRQRVELARAWAANTQLILLDEALSSLDYPLRCEIQEDLQTLWQAEKRTVLLVTHDPEEACFLSDRIFILHPPGEIEQVDVPFERPRRQQIRFDPEFVALRKRLAWNVE